MFRSDLKLTICYLSCFLQERKLVFSQGGFCPENSLFPRIDVCGTKVKLQLQLHRLSEAIPNLSKTVVASLKRVCISLALALLVPHRTTNRGFGTAVIQPKMAEIRSTTENRELWNSQKEVPWGVCIQRTRNELTLKLICSISSEISN